MNGHWASFKIRNKIFITFLAAVIVPLTVATIWSYTRIERMLYNNIKATMNNTLIQVSEDVDDVMKNIAVARYILIMNQGGISMLDEYVRYYNDQEEGIHSYNYLSAVKIENIDFLLNNVMNSFLPDGSRITLYNFKGIAISVPHRSEGRVDVERLMNNEQLQQLLAVDVGSPSVWSVTHGDFTSADTEQEYISYLQLLRQQEERQNFFFAVSVPESYIVEHILGNGLSEGSSMYLVGKDGNVLAYAGAPIDEARITAYVREHIASPGEDQATVEAGEAMMLSDELPYADWRLLMVVPESGVHKQVNLMRTQYMAILLLSFLAFGLSTYWLLKRITGPIEKLTRYTRGAEAGRLDIAFDIRSRDEIGVLAASFQSMLRRLKLFTDQKVYEEKKRNEYKYKALQAQINPHFLLNTLNSIKWLAILENNNNVAELIASLGRLMEMSLFRGQEDISFQEELINVASYVDLQKSRYDNLFSAIYDVEEAVKRCACPRLLLQPIVENAIIHGIASANRTCELRVAGRLEDGGKTVRISVADTGVGIPSDKLAELLDSGKDMEAVFKGIGLSNVDERIKLRYGQDYGLTINSEQGSGTTVMILIPFIPWEELKNDTDYDR